jgi:regulator of sigma D
MRLNMWECLDYVHVGFYSLIDQPTERYKGMAMQFNLITKIFAILCKHQD